LTWMTRRMPGLPTLSVVAVVVVVVRMWSADRDVERMPLLQEAFPPSTSRPCLRIGKTFDQRRWMEGSVNKHEQGESMAHPHFCKAPRLPALFYVELPPRPFLPCLRSPGVARAPKEEQERQHVPWRWHPSRLWISHDVQGRAAAATNLPRG